MLEAQTKAKSTETADERDAVWSPDLPARHKVRPRLRIISVLITLVMVALAVPLGWAMWDAYMGAPWTRDGTVRAYVVTMAPEVAGRIVGLPVADNQFVHKGDLLMLIDPRDYRIAVSRSEAAVNQAEANARNAEIESQRRQKLSNVAVTVEQQQIYATNAVVAQAQYHKPGSGAKPLRQAGDQSGKPSYVDWRTAPKSGKNLLALQLVQHGPRFAGFDRRQAQGHMVQDFRPYAAKADHHDRPKERTTRDWGAPA